MLSLTVVWSTNRKPINNKTKQYFCCAVSTDTQSHTHAVCTHFVAQTQRTFVDVVLFGSLLWFWLLSVAVVGWWCCCCCFRCVSTSIVCHNVLYRTRACVCRFSRALIYVRTQCTLFSIFVIGILPLVLFWLFWLFWFLFHFDRTKNWCVESEADRLDLIVCAARKHIENVKSLRVISHTVSYVKW